jgi:hypothetical protein
MSRKLTMNRRRWMALSGAAVAARPGLAGRAASAPQPGGEKIPPDQLLLKDYDPRSVFKIPVTVIKKAKFPIVDVHHHADVATPADVEARLRDMDAAGVERVIVFSLAGERFDKNYALYSKYPKRFDVWCGLDVTRPVVRA